MKVCLQQLQEQSEGTEDASKKATCQAGIEFRGYSSPELVEPSVILTRLQEQ